MTTTFPGTSGLENLMTPRKNRKNVKMSPKTAHRYGKKENNKRNTKPAAGPGRTGDVVSDDDSQPSDAEGGGAAVGHDEYDEDQPDGFALSGGVSPDGGATSHHLTGLHPDPFVDERAAYDSALDDNNDDDDDYTAVADMSDDGESLVDEDQHEDSILRLAERDLIAEFERSEKPRNTTMVSDGIDQMDINDNAPRARRSSMLSEEGLEDLDDWDLSVDPFRGLHSTDELYKSMVEDAEVAFDNALTRWRMSPPTRSRENSVQSTTQKKVRFESTSSRASSMSSDEDPRDAYPDLFEDLDNPLPRHRSLTKTVIPTQSPGPHYDFDFEDECDGATAEADGESDSHDDTIGADSDDDGDTTDEETIDEQLERMREMQKAKGKPTDHIGVSHPGAPTATDKSGRKSASVSRRSSTTGVFETPRNVRKPKSGIFAHDPTSATVSADIRGSGVKLVCPSNPPEEDRAYWERARAALSSRDGSPRASWTRATPQAASIPRRPLTTKSTLGTLFDYNLDFMRNHDVAGIANDLIQQSGGGGMQYSLPSSMTTEDDGSGDDSNVNMADYLQIDDMDSDVDEPMSAGTMTPQQQDFCSDLNMASSPIQRRNSAGPGLLDHLEQQRGLVSSFRTNQTRARHISSLASNLTKRAQASEQNAFPVGRRGAANTPVTPVRKTRGSQDMSVTGSGVKKASASPMVGRRRQSRGNSLSGIHQTLSVDRLVTHGGNL